MAVMRQQFKLRMIGVQEFNLAASYDKHDSRWQYLYNCYLVAGRLVKQMCNIKIKYWRNRAEVKSLLKTMRPIRLVWVAI